MTDANAAPVRYWHGELSIYGRGLSQAQIDSILEALIAAVEAAGASVGGGFSEVDADGEALK